MNDVNNTQLSLDDKMQFLRKAAELWEFLSDRQKGRLEGKLEAFEQFSVDDRRNA